MSQIHYTLATAGEEDLPLGHLSAVRSQEAVNVPLRARTDHLLEQHPRLEGYPGRAVILTRTDGARDFPARLVVARAEDRGASRGEHRISLYLESPCAALARLSAHRAYVGRTPAQVVAELAALVGVAVELHDCDRPARAMILQRGRALPFMVALLSESGLSFVERFDAASGRCTLHVFERAARLPAALLEVEGSLPVRGPGGDAATREHARDLRLTRTHHPHATSLRLWDETQPQAPGHFAVGDGELTHELFDLPIGRGPVDPATLRRAHLDGAGGARHAHGGARHDAVSLRGLTTAPGLSPGCSVVFDGIPSQWMITSIRHRFDAPDAGLAAEGRAPDGYRNAVTAVERDNWAPPLRRRRAGAIETGTIVGVGPVARDGLCQYRVRLHTASPGHDETCFIPAVTPWSGPGVGVQFTHRVGGHVLVGYRDADSPYLIGAIFTTGTMAPAPGTDELAASVVLRTNLFGRHDGFEARISDEPERPSASMNTPGEVHVRIGTDRTTRVGASDDTIVGRDRRTSVAGDEIHEVRGRLEINAAQGLVLRVGEAVIAITRSGEIFIDGALTKIQSGKPGCEP